VPLLFFAAITFSSSVKADTETISFNYQLYQDNSGLSFPTATTATISYDSDSLAVTTYTDSSVGPITSGIENLVLTSDPVALAQDAFACFDSQQCSIAGSAMVTLPIYGDVVIDFHGYQSNQAVTIGGAASYSIRHAQVKYIPIPNLSIGYFHYVDTVLSLISKAY
jgi:hypothetical protein